MKKSECILWGIFYIVLTIVLICAMNQIESHQVSPLERYLERAEEKNKQVKSDFVNKNNENIDKNGQTSFEFQNIKYEFESYEIVEDVDIQTQQKYPGDFFYEGILPDSEEFEELRDLDAIKEESTELRDLWENEEKYSTDEAIRIFNENLDVVEKHTEMVHVKNNYIFIKCHITNLLNEKNTDYLNEIYLNQSSPDLKENITDDSMVYFDKSMHVTGEERIYEYFAYDFDPNEKIDCVIGFKVKQEIENPKYYFGIVDVTLQDAGINPALGKNMIKLSDLKNDIE